MRACVYIDLQIEILRENLRMLIKIADVFSMFVIYIKAKRY